MLTKEMRDVIRTGMEAGVSADCHLTRCLLDDIDELRRLLRLAADRWDDEEIDPPLLYRIGEVLGD